MKSIFLLLLPAIVLCSCHTQKQEDESAHAVTHKGDIIHIGSESPVLSKLTKETVKQEPYRMEFTTSGVVQAIPSNYAEVASPVSGRITKSFVRLGQKVAPGSPIFEISAPAVYEAGKSYYQAHQEMELALKKDYENMVAALKVFQINPDEMALGQPLIVRSPIAGEVVKDRIVIGQYMKEDAEPVAVIADLSKVWVVAHVKEKDLSLIQALDEVEIRLVAMPDKPISGKIYHISEMLDPDTRSVEVLIECDNSTRLMKPEMYGTVKLSDREAEVIRIPTSAILQEEENMYVLVELGNNDYRKQKIETGHTEDGKTVVLSGLNVGDEIVVTGAFYLLDAR